MTAFSPCAWLVLVCFWTREARGDRPILPTVSTPLSNVGRPMHASVYAEPSTHYGTGVKQIVELLRFVTGYSTGMEVLVDVSPQSPLLDAVSQSAEVQAFAFIDTWVGQQSGWVEDEYLVVPDVRNGTGPPKCELRSDEHSDKNPGNGMALSAELVFWEHDPSVTDVRPRETITLASGPAGGSYDVGTIRYFEGWSINQGREVLLDEAVDFGTTDESEISVYPCPEGGLPKARRLFMWVREAVRLALLSRTEELTEHLDWVRYDLIDEQMVDVKVLRVCPETHALICEYGPGLELQPSMPIFVKDGELRAKFVEHRRQKLYKKHIGKIAWVADKEFAIQLDIDCVPSEATAGKPHLQIPASPRYEERAERIVRALETYATTRTDEDMFGFRTVHYSEYLGDVNLLNGTDVAATQKIEQSVPDALFGAPPFWPRFWQLQPDDETLEPLQLLGRVSPGAAPSRTWAVKPKRRRSQSASWSASSLAEEASTPESTADVAPSFFQASAGHGRRVCVVDEHRSGFIFDRKFDAPAMDAGDRTLMQIVITGHGWRRTDMKCGEFCHTLYRLNFNDHTAFNVILWRDDCAENPLGPDQEGTWQNSRNGWCPGSVETGFYFDVTDALREGRNELMVSMLVWNEKTRKYESYTDDKGYRFNETAKLVVGMTLSVYPKAAVRAIRAQNRAYTAAERALRDGASRKDAVVQMKAAEMKMASSFLQSSKGKGSSSSEESKESTEASREARIRQGLELLKYLAMQQGTRTPSGVMVAQQVRKGQKTPAAQTSALEKTSSLKSQWDLLLAQHHLLMSDVEVREMLQRAKNGLRSSADSDPEDSQPSISPDPGATSDQEVPVTVAAVASGEHVEAESPNTKMQMDHVAEKGVVKYGTIFPGDQVMYVAEQHVRNTTIVATDTIVMVKKVEIDRVLVHFPYGEVVYVRYEALRFIMETKPDTEGTCDKLCESEYTPLLGTGSCRELIDRYEQMQKISLPREEIMARINKACDDQCFCDAGDIMEDGSNLPDYSRKCKKLVRPVTVRDAFEDTIHYDEREGSIMDYEAAAPWYCYSSKQEGLVGDDMDGQRVHRVKIFDRTNFHVGRQTATSTLKTWSLPHDFKWGRAALHLRIDRPRWHGIRSDGSPWPEEIDHWDRLGTLGFYLPGSTERLALFPADERKKREWPMKPAQDQNQIFKIMQHEIQHSKRRPLQKRMKRHMQPEQFGGIKL